MFRRGGKMTSRQRQVLDSWVAIPSVRVSVFRRSQCSQEVSSTVASTCRNPLGSGLGVSSRVIGVSAPACAISVCRNPLGSGLGVSSRACSGSRLLLSSLVAIPSVRVSVFRRRSDTSGASRLMPHVAIPSVRVSVFRQGCDFRIVGEECGSVAIPSVRVSVFRPPGCLCSLCSPRPSCGSQSPRFGSRCFVREGPGAGAGVGAVRSQSPRFGSRCFVFCIGGSPFGRMKKSRNPLGSGLGVSSYAEGEAILRIPAHAGSRNPLGSGLGVSSL